MTETDVNRGWGWGGSTVYVQTASELLEQRKGGGPDESLESLP